MTARLLGMEVANASMYDGSTATAEAVLMSQRIFRKKRTKVLFAGAIHPEYVEVTRTYLTDPEKTLSFASAGEDGRTNLDELSAMLGSDVAAVVVQFPNFLGLLEDLKTIRKMTAEQGVLMVVVFSEPVAFGLIKPPGEFDADIVVGEGQSFGLPVSYGGPLLGMMTTKKKYVRAIPGRLVGKTKDRHGNDAYVITLATREQHIRRARATSNICTNEGLCALTAGIHLSLLGNEGLNKLATLNHDASRYLAGRLGELDGVTLPYEKTPWFNEFVIELPALAQDVFDALSAKGIVPGIPLSRFFPGQENRMLVTTTELNTLDQMERYCELLLDFVG